MDYIKEAEKIFEELSFIRHRIHENPELGNHEFKTSALAEDYLKALGIETRRLTETALMATLRGGKPGKTIAFRADMDALPVTEKTGCAFSSKIPGCMHACGHDIHTTSLLGAAKILSDHKEDLCGEVRFFFEPDEEGDGGAKRMIDAECMEGVSAVYGAHVDPSIALGTIGVRFGKFYAASNMFNVTVHGKSAHGAEPEKGIDALLTAAKMVAALKELPKALPKGEAVLSVGTFNSGFVRNIISDKAEFKGIIRTLGEDVKEKMLLSFGETLDKISSENKTTVDAELFSTHNGIVNTDRETSLVKDALKKASGINVIEIEKPLMTSEDFGFFIDEAAGSFYHIGVGSPSSLHSSDFLPDDRALIYGAAAHAAVAVAELS